MAANTAYVVEIEINSVWVDITGYVDTVNMPAKAETGDGSETSDASGNLELELLNADQRFTPGNTLGPYYPYLTTGTRIRLRDRIDSLTMVVDLFTGYIQFPEISAWTASTASAPRDQRITITALDRLGWLDRSRPFLSTLGEHILYNGQQTGALKGFWPLTAPYGYAPYAISQVTFVTDLAQQSLPALSLGPRSTIAQNGNSIPGDDLQTTRLVPGLSGTSVADSTFLALNNFTDVPVSATTFTCSFWVYFEDVHSDVLIWEISGDFGGFTDSIEIFRDGVGGWHFLVTLGVTSLNVALNALPTYKWTLVSMRFTLPSGLCELWIDDDDPVTGTVSGGAIPTATVMNSPTFGLNMQGNVAYLQVYTGEFTRTMHLAQFQVGLYGMERQLPGQRIRTVAAYAGVPSTDLNGVDDGSSYMTRASLAGKSPLTAMTEASDTEQGRLYADGSGQLVFAGRKRLYNI